MTSWRLTTMIIHIRWQRRSWRSVSKVSGKVIWTVVTWWKCSKTVVEKRGTESYFDDTVESRLSSGRCGLFSLLRQKLSCSKSWASWNSHCVLHSPEQPLHARHQIIFYFYWDSYFGFTWYSVTNVLSQVNTWEIIYLHFGERFNDCRSGIH